MYATLMKTVLWQAYPDNSPLYRYSWVSISPRFFCYWGMINRSSPHPQLQKNHKEIDTSVGIGPDEWFYWFVVVLVENCPRDHGPDGQ